MPRRRSSTQRASTTPTTWRGPGRRAQAEAVSGRTPSVRLAETLAGYERGEIDILINAQLLAEAGTRRDIGHATSPRLPAAASTSSASAGSCGFTRAKEAGVVVDFVPKSATSPSVSSRYTAFSMPTCAKAPASRLRRGDASSDGHAASSPRAMVGTGDARRPPSPRGHRPRVAACGPRAWTTTSSSTGRPSRDGRCASTSGPTSPKLTESGATVERSSSS